MENLMFCLNATGPIFLMMVFGLFLRKVGILDEDFANRMNKFVFKIPLPFLLFGDLAALRYRTHHARRDARCCRLCPSGPGANP